MPDQAEPPAIAFRMDTLRRQSGTTRVLKKFAFDLRRIAEAQPLPEYSLNVERRRRQAAAGLLLPDGR